MSNLNYITEEYRTSDQEFEHYPFPNIQQNDIPAKLKVAIVHEWFVDYAGSEKCAESFNNIFPDSDIYSLVDFLKEQEREIILKGKKSKTSFIQKLPYSQSIFRYYLPFFPYAIEQFDLRDYNIIISNSHSVAKGVLTNTYQMHVCYCHTPMRYIWNNYFEYINTSNLNKGIKRFITSSTLQKLRNWDYQTSNRPDFFIANSKHIARQIKKRYNRDAYVIYPPVDTHKFSPNNNKEEFYLTISRMVPYKRIDLIINAFSKLTDKKLIIIGDGPLKNRLKNLARPNIEFIDPVPFNTLKTYLEKAKGYISAAEEDFGITVVEAMAAGTPVIAFRRGGTGESVIDNKTGILFNEQSVESLIECIIKYESRIDSFDVHSIKEYSSKFNRKCFEWKIKKFIAEKLVDSNI